MKYRCTDNKIQLAIHDAEVGAAYVSLGKEGTFEPAIQLSKAQRVKAAQALAGDDWHVDDGYYRAAAARVTVQRSEAVTFTEPPAPINTGSQL